MIANLILFLFINQIDTSFVEGVSNKSVVVCPETTITILCNLPLTIKKDYKGEYYWSENFFSLKSIKLGEYTYFFSQTSSGYVMIDSKDNFVSVNHLKFCVEIRYGKCYVIKRDQTKN
jgi:hypothetical protein